MHGIENTVERGICIGCGACSAASGGAITLSLGPTRLFEPNLANADASSIRSASRVCPFSDESPNEDILGAPNPSASTIKNNMIGEYTRTFAGRVSDDEYTVDSSSGGLTSWLVGKLISEGMVDAAITVGRSSDESLLFEYQSADAETVSGKRKSNYYAATMAEALEAVALSSDRFVLIGVPCFIRAARALCLEKPEFSERLPYFVSLVCGHYKTHAYAESLAWQLGIDPGDLADADFRVKDLARTANDYDFAARAEGSDEWRHAPMRSLLGGNWGHNAFQPEACNFCDDVVGETADVSFGDAWLPRFVRDSRGTNVVVSRNSQLDSIFDRGTAEGEIETFAATAEDVVLSQAGGFRHRREGLSVRLADDLAAGLSVPEKRVSAGTSGIDRRRVKLIRYRRYMAAASHGLFDEALRSSNLQHYLEAQRKRVRRYERIDKRWHARIAVKCRRIAGRVVRRVRRGGADVV